MTPTTFPRFAPLAAFAAVALALPGVAPPASAQVVQRPIGDFLDVQGTFPFLDENGDPFLFVPPVANFLGWTDPQRGIGISVDYAGLADEFMDGEFGTRFAGKVTERPLPDGRCLVRVELHTRDALTWVMPLGGDNPFGDNPLLFGARVTDVAMGATPALGDSKLTLEYVTPECGYRMMDLLEILAAPPEGVELRSMKFVASADGQLADGTPARVHVTQVALFHTGFHGAVADGFPVERITLTPLGP